MEKNQLNTVEVRTELEETVTAPVSQGQRLGTLTVLVDGQILTQVPMLAQESVAKLTWWQIFRNVLRHMAMVG